MIRATLPVTLPAYPNRLCHYILADSLSELGDFALTTHITPSHSSHSWDFNLGLSKAIQYCTTGDLHAVEQSDALLSRMEAHLTMPSTRSTWIDSVTGAFPNIPALLAGHPLNMRYRTKTQSESAPLAIMVDLGVSAGITSTQTQTRGTAILALARALSAHRPIELWVLDISGSLNPSHPTDAVIVAARIETSPLNLSTACYALCHPAFVRQILYGLATKHHSWNGGWPFSMNRALKRAEMEALLAPMFTHTTSTLCLPGLHVRDESVTDPEAWLTRQLAEHDPLRLEDVV